MHTTTHIMLALVGALGLSGLATALTPTTADARPIHVFADARPVHVAANTCDVHRGDLTIDSRTRLRSGSCLVVEGDLKLRGDVSLRVTITEVTGSVEIEGFNGRDLRVLEGLTRIGGDLEIEDNRSLRNLRGLESLRAVDGDVSIDDNRNLQNLDGLRGLESIRGDLDITDNRNLSSVQGLRNLKRLGDEIEIKDNRSLCQRDAAALARQLNARNGDIAGNRGTCR